MHAGDEHDEGLKCLETVARFRTQVIWNAKQLASRVRSTLMLGVSVGCEERGPSTEDKEQATRHLAIRVSFLPCSLRFKACLASTMLASKASWGIVLSASGA